MWHRRMETRQSRARLTKSFSELVELEKFAMRLRLTSVGVNAAHLLSFGRSPLYLIQRRLLGHGLKFVVKTDMWRES